jgi:hypothetical protein
MLWTNLKPAEIEDRRKKLNRFMAELLDTANTSTGVTALQRVIDLLLQVSEDAGEDGTGSSAQHDRRQVYKAAAKSTQPRRNKTQNALPSLDWPASGWTW